MKRFSKILIVILIVSMSIFSFVGCQSKDASNAGGGTQQERKFDKGAMEKRIKTNLDSLVKAGTITDDQSSKILTALTTRTQGTKGNGGQGNEAGKRSNGSGRRNGGSNALNDLVKQGVITQAQADTVMKSVMGNRQNNNASGSNQANQ
jgi:polyhydroxyalkanoate synthesis regulator phasin